MKRFAPLALVVLALAALPVAAFADDGGSTPAPTATTTTTTPTTAPSAPTTPAGAAARTRVEILRLRLEIVRLRFALHCRGDRASSDRCVAFARKVLQRLQTLDGNVQKLIATIEQNCTSTSTDPRCKNADRKLAFLQKVDTHLQSMITRIQNWLNGKGSPSPDGSASSDSALDNAASDLGQLANANG